jgi:hypothetical protein
LLLLIVLFQELRERHAQLKQRFDLLQQTTADQLAENAEPRAGSEAHSQAETPMQVLELQRQQAMTQLAREEMEVRLVI